MIFITTATDLFLNIYYNQNIVLRQGLHNKQANCMPRNLKQIHCCYLNTIYNQISSFIVLFKGLNDEESRETKPTSFSV